MGFIRAGFTGGFIGIVIGVADIFVNSKIIEKMSSVGLWLASFFGKICINTQEIQCTLSEKFTTIIATIVGNSITYFVLGVLLSLAISVIKLWMTPSKPAELASVEQQPQKVQQVPVEQQVVKQPEQIQQVQQPVQQVESIPVEQQPQQVQQVPVEQQVVKQPIKQEKQPAKKRSKKKSKVSKKSKKN